METVTAIEDLTGVGTPAGVLAAVRERCSVVDRAEADKLRLAVDWAAMHSTDSLDHAATLYDDRGVDTAMTVAGAGAPLVAEFSICEFAAALGVPTETGKAFLGEALELRYRLPRVWARVQDGLVPAWRARRIARQTLVLSREAAAYVDRHVGPVVHEIGPVQTERLVEEAIARFMPDLAEETRRHAADGRHFTIDHHQVSFAGTSAVSVSWTWPTPWTSMPRWPGSPPSSRISAASSPWTCGARWRSGNWPAANPPSTWARTSRHPPRPVVRSSSTCISPRTRSPAPGRLWGGSRTAGTGRSPPSRSESGAATPTPT